ncbi:TPA: hypothetical protein DEG21_04600 [Patescibacteria group bacterium]|nr:hypothetical protein [Candidatus Gracilibacteria bacterium]
MISGERGIAVSTLQSNYMKYDLSKLSLGDSFSIEMSVRGGALNTIERKSGTYKLFNFSG